MAQLYITGGAIVVQNMGKFQAGMARKVRGALLAAGLQLQRESQKLAPVEFGNLKGSAYTKPTGTGFATYVDVGYTSGYALFVHEKVQMKLKGQPRRPSPPHQGKYWDPQGQAQAKFLEEPARRMAPQLAATITKILKKP